MTTQLPTAERDVLASVLSYLTMRRIFVWRQNQGGMHVDTRFIRFAHVDGISDVIGIYRGRFLAIETKAPGKNPTADQQDFLNRVKAEGGIAIVARSIDDVIAALNAADREGTHV